MGNLTNSLELQATRPIVAIDTTVRAVGKAVPVPIPQRVGHNPSEDLGADSYGSEELYECRGRRCLTPFQTTKRHGSMFSMGLATRRCGSWSKP